MARAAGSSALAMYRRARRSRRRRVGGGTLLIAAGAAIAGLLVVPGVVPAVVAGGLGGAGAVLAGGVGAVGGAGAVVVAGVAGAVVVVGLLLLLSTLVGGSRDVARWKRGAEGERRTAHLLDALPSRRWTVWHDLRVPGSRANIDHLVVGGTGVWVVDSKSTRAAVRSGWRSVRFGDRRLDTAPTRWEADAVFGALEDRLGELPWGTVRPVVAVHGEGLRRRGAKVGGVRVVPADRLTARLARGRRRLRRSERQLVCDALADVFGPPASGSGRLLGTVVR